ncbi:hypothetical protein DOM21_17535 [Bacteriovorax stolpii]|uniref:hypothetical protein n=1 Tax=Bacteriovorax stolpii TaxID=960 RepID=UPI00115AC990|nr:hypothetical protein [Bacteriovorax stolpii]QDK43225.1 hypothetical protein DOM21_17535 [Bacteriovorax stolpii]
MKPILKTISFLAFAIAQASAGTIQFSKLTQDEKKFVIARKNSDLIKYDCSTDQVIIDDEFENQLRENGILQTEDAVKSNLCEGGEQG